MILAAIVAAVALLAYACFAIAATRKPKAHRVKVNW